MKHLGDFSISKVSFPKLEVVLKPFRKKEFTALSEQQKIEQISRALLGLIESASEGSFTLIQVADFIEKVRKEGFLDHYHISHFEMWLNQFSGLGFEDGNRIRGKIAGRYIPRDAYQLLFPLGMGKIYAGSHFITAHGSPDLDTTVASFWGWVDAFAARVSEGLHVWNVPGGEPPAQAETNLLFYDVFGDEVFASLAKGKTALSVSGLDLASQHGILKKEPDASVFDIDHGKEPQAVVMVDKEGFYLGEWRSTDVDRVRSVINLLNQCLRWYENDLHVKLIGLFGSKKLTKKEMAQFSKGILEMKIEACEPAREFSEKQTGLVDAYLKKVLGVASGMKSSFADFAKAMKKLKLTEFEAFVELIDRPTVFDAKGALIEDRSKIFNYLAKVITGLEKVIYSVRVYVDRLDVAMEVKSKVLGLLPHHVNYRADLEEIRAKMDSFPYLTVTSSDHRGKLFPIGVIHATDIFKPSLGTVSLRDFSNREETKIPPYLDIISVVDHHKSQLTTSVPTVFWINDCQSSNTLVAELSFQLTDPYGTGGMTLAQIEKQIAQVQKNLKTPSSKRANKRVLQRLLQKYLAASQKQPYFVSPEREAAEYLHCLYAILDDTDLLTKVSPRDVECVAALLNRLKSITLKEEVEIIHFDDISRDEKFAKKAAARILQNGDMYSLYKKIYLSKEEAMEQSLKEGTIFADTKEQNGCCRVGQTKLYSRNFKYFAKHAPELRKRWLTKAREVHGEKKEIDLHLQMISTVAGAEELYSGKPAAYPHKDEIWIWIPSTEEAIEHLKTFLSGFKAVAANLEMEVDFLGENKDELEEIFTESFLSIPMTRSNQKLSIAVLRFKAGSLNSRKAMVSPFLPNITS